jgi:hypothetical protein
MPDFSATETLSGSNMAEAYAVVLLNGPEMMVLMVEFGYDGDSMNDGVPDYAQWDRNMVR